MKTYLISSLARGSEIALYWTINEHGNRGRWVADINQARVYLTERAVHLAWTCIRRLYPHMPLEVLTRDS